MLENLPFVDELRQHIHLASICLEYLCYRNFNSGVCLTKQALKERVENFQFLRYAARYQRAHVYRNGEYAQEIFKYVKNLFDLMFKNQMTQSQIYEAQGELTEDVQQYLSYSNPTILYYAALFGLVDIMQNLLENGADVNALGGIYGDAL